MVEKNERFLEMMRSSGHSKPHINCESEVNYFWKRFDFTGGKTFEQNLDEHPYCKDPIRAVSK